MSMRRVGVYGAAGVIVAGLIIAGFMTSGLEIPGFRSDKGTLSIKLTDAPVELKHLNVTITELKVHKAEHEGEEGEWVALPFVDDKAYYYVDILSLQNVSRDLSTAEISIGNYTKIRMTVSKANATYSDGSIVEPLIVPAGHIDVNVHFEIEADFETVLLVDMTAHISNTDRLSPVLKAIVVSAPP